MEIPSKYIDSLLSDNVDDFDTAIHLLLNLEKFDIKDLKVSVNKLYCDNKIFQYLLVEEETLVRKESIGIWQQLENGYEHSYKIDDFSLDTLQKVLTRQNNFWGLRQKVDTPLYVMDPTRTLKLDPGKNKFKFSLPNLVL